MNINLDLIGWEYSLLIMLIVLFFIWAIFGGGNYKYVGLSPLMVGKKCSHFRREGIDNTPELPDLSNFNPPEKPINRFYDSNSLSFSIEDEPSVGGLVKTSFSKDELLTPRTAALGSFKCYKNGKKSKGELLCKQAIEEIYGVPFYCVRPDFLKNPETGRNLEIDMYNDSLKIGVEYSGEQHFVFPNNFHRTYEEFINQVRRDQYKVDACDSNGVYLISVPFNVPLNLESIKKYIQYYLPENHAKRLEDKNDKLIKQG